MNEEPNPTPNPKRVNSAGVAVIWLVFAFVPSLVAAPFINGRYAAHFSGPAFLFFAAACCLCSGFGVLRGVKNQAVRVVLGLFLVGVFFILNVFIVILVGCSGTGRIAP
ncbi:MAG TPA: hypothetical protein VG938_12800 [Verrucomicrobiae bacterium]|nr:hypothetical protein [Verrucomicrobiae bacterium]